MKQYYVYILTNSTNTVLYIGITSNLVKRIYEHQNKLADGFTKQYQVRKLLYYEVYTDIYAAISREKQLKHWKRDWKIELIKAENPHFRDLANSIA